MTNIRNRNLRFNIDDEEHQKAWSYLQNMNKKELGSQNQLILRTINEFFERYYLLEENPFLETREKEEKFMDRIADGVEQRISEQIPTIVSAYMMQTMGQMICEAKGKEGVVNTVKEAERSMKDGIAEETRGLEDNPDLDWDFLG